jgi:Ni/Co efflux regulator RcnB
MYATVASVRTGAHTKETTLKKLFSAAIALSLFAGTAYAVPNNDRNDRGQYSATRQSDGQREWPRGGRLPEPYRQSQYVVGDWQQRRLASPPAGYRWYRNDNNQYLLAAIATGIIADVVSQNDYTADRRYQNEPQWSRGDRLSAGYRNDQYVVSSWRSYDLRRPGRGYEWVRINHQFLLIGRRSGRIVDVVDVESR